ncbi:heterogeneous nuclear ribonucleoprotein G [Fusarium napiforme]|uniref:Heterogeneous nuclear ribonucleoprotein G n=1 Tax=Fusarium napiforme TaxID=42672 RepID=A0A8H5JKE1_9HYPO|nr:heterogeneous nuclear ribonucleoprotein G [Fusarium napiforme]
MSKLYVGNLAGSTTDESLRKTFADYGQVLDSILEASAKQLSLDGNHITVNMANARPTGGSGGGFGGGQGGYGGGYQQGGRYGNSGY